MRPATTTAGWDTALSCSTSASTSTSPSSPPSAAAASSSPSVAADAASPAPSSPCLECRELHPGVVRRVKVYTLDESDVWLDQGTGQAQLHLQCPRSHKPAGEAATHASTSAAHTAAPACEEEHEGEHGWPSLLLVVWPEAGDSVHSSPRLLASHAGVGDLPGSSSRCSPSSASAAACAAPLLKHRVSASVSYALQADTILSWTDGRDGREVALSFQDAQRCQDVLQEIDAHQHQQRHATHANTSQQQRKTGEGEEEEALASQPAQLSPVRLVRSMRAQSAAVEDDEAERAASAAQPLEAASSTSSSSPSSSAFSPTAGGAAGDDGSEEDDWLSAAAAFPLPSSLSLLPCLHRRLVDSGVDSALRHSIVAQLSSPGSPWLCALFELVRSCEVCGDLEGLQRLFGLLVALLNAMHDEQVVELLLTPQLALFTFTALEYDPAIVARLTSTQQLRLPLRRHTQALQAARCYSVLPLLPAAASSSPGSAAVEVDESELAALEQRLHLYHRLQYAKDVVLLAHLDDAATAAFTSLSYTTRASIISITHHHTTLVHHITHALRTHLHTTPDDTAVDDEVEGVRARFPHLRSPSPPSPTPPAAARRTRSRPFDSAASHCPPHRAPRVEHLADEDDEGEVNEEDDSGELPVPVIRADGKEEEEATAPSVGAGRFSCRLSRPLLFRRRVLLASSLLSLSSAVQPHLRSAFADSWMERGLVHILSAVLQAEAERAGRLQRRAEGGAAAESLRSSIRRLRRLFPLALSVLTLLHSHCPDAFRLRFFQLRAAAQSPRSSLLTALIRTLALPRHVDAATAHQTVAFIRALMEGEDEEQMGGAGGAGRGEGAGSGTSVLRSLLHEEEALAAALRLVASHSHPHAVRISSLALLEWLSCLIARLPPADVQSLSHRQRLPQLLNAFLTISPSCTSPSAVAAAASASAGPSLPPLPSPHPVEVLCAAVRLLSALLSVPSAQLCSSLIAAGVLRSLLRLLVSPLLCRSNLLQSSILALFTSVVQQQPLASSAAAAHLRLLRHVDAEVQALESSSSTHFSLLSPFQRLRSRLEEEEEEEEEKEDVERSFGRGGDEGEEGEGGGGSRGRQPHARRQRKRKRADADSHSPAPSSPRPPTTSSSASSLSSTSPSSSWLGRPRLVRRVVDDAYFDDEDDDGEAQGQAKDGVLDGEQPAEEERQLSQATQPHEHEQAQVGGVSASSVELSAVLCAARERRQREQAAAEEALDLRQRVSVRRQQLAQPQSQQQTRRASSSGSVGAGSEEGPSGGTNSGDLHPPSAVPSPPAPRAGFSSSSPSPLSLSIRFRPSARREDAITPPSLAAGEAAAHADEDADAARESITQPTAATLSKHADIPPVSPPSSSPSAAPARSLPVPSPSTPSLASSSSSSSPSSPSMRPRSPLPPEFAHVDELEGLHLRSSGAVAPLHSSHSQRALQPTPAQQQPQQPATSSSTPLPPRSRRHMRGDEQAVGEPHAARLPLQRSSDTPPATAARPSGQADKTESEGGDSGAAGHEHAWAPHPSSRARTSQVPG